MSTPMTDERLAEIRDLDNAFRKLPSKRVWDDVRLYDDVARSMVEMLAEVDRLRAEMAAAQKLCEIYFNIAAAAVGEDATRKARDSEIAWDKALASTTPEQAEKIQARIREQLIDAMMRETAGVSDAEIVASYGDKEDPEGL